MAISSRAGCINPSGEFVLLELRGRYEIPRGVYPHASNTRAIFVWKVSKMTVKYDINLSASSTISIFVFQITDRGNGAATIILCCLIITWRGGNPTLPVDHKFCLLCTRCFSYAKNDFARIGHYYAGDHSKISGNTFSRTTRADWGKGKAKIYVIRSCKCALVTIYG